jgi:hypothetical protein
MCEYKRPFGRNPITYRILEFCPILPKGEEMTRLEAQARRQIKKAYSIRVPGTKLPLLEGSDECVEVVLVDGRPPHGFRHERTFGK